MGQLEIRLAVRWLELNDLNYEVGLPEAARKGRQAAAIEAARENQEPLAGHDGKRKHQEDEKEKCPPESLDGSSSKKRRIRRLRRDHPEAAQRLERGEFKSARAAER
ncbi:MAG TPA: hypothetical protein VH592_06650 [Gemmataceae bacterium]